MRPSWFATASFCVAAAAQCDPTWSAGSSLAGADGRVRALALWDSDGPGPRPACVVSGGDFSLTGSVFADRVAAYDLATREWIAFFPPGTEGSIRALAVLPNGDLVAGGVFTAIGGTAAANVAVFRNGGWQPLGVGIAGEVRALLPLPNGDLVVGGTFLSAGGVPASCVARWDGAQWSGVGGGVGGSTGSFLVPVGAYALARAPNGDLLVGGAFSSAGSVPAANLARWDGAVWSELGGGVAGASLSPIVQTIRPLANGTILVGGDFTTAGGTIVGNLAVWTGAGWFGQAAGSGLLFEGSQVRAAVQTANGDLWAGGAFPQVSANGDLWAGGAFPQVGAAAARHVARRPAGSNTWTALGSGIDRGNLVDALLELPNGDVLVAGDFFGAGGLDVANLAVWDGAAWSATGNGLATALYDVTALADGDLVVTGIFASLDGVPANGIARGDGTTWRPLGGGLTSGGFPASAEAVVELPNGDLVVGGGFNAAGGQPIRALARWNGQTWSQIGVGLSQIGPLGPAVHGAVLLPNGDLVVAGRFAIPSVGAQHVARWDGSAWSAIGGYAGTPPTALAVTAAGEPVLASPAGTATWSVQVFDGTSWTPLGGGFGEFQNIGHLGLGADGSLLAGGSFRAAFGAPADFLAQWNGTAWVGVGSGLDFSVVQTAVLPNGDLVAAGFNATASSNTLRGIARLRAGVWTTLDGGLSGPDVSSGAAGAAWTGERLYVVGGFRSAGGRPSPFFAELTTPCAPQVVRFGVGCAGSGGANELAATSQPWLGATFTAEATGLPAGLAVALHGLSTALLPLAAVLPQGGPGCNLLVAPEVTVVDAPVGGALGTSIRIPNAPALAGQIVHHQVLGVGIDSLGAITELTGTNRLTLVLGAF